LLEQLAAHDREILVLRYLEDLTFPEIASVTGLSEGAVKMRHLRALERIRVLLGANGELPKL
jgi:RNA polymerase sigma-70 factor (ECF subfamily)